MGSNLTRKEALKLKKCPECGSKKLAKAKYANEVYLECEGCWTVIKRIK